MIQSQRKGTNGWIIRGFQPELGFNWILQLRAEL